MYLDISKTQEKTELRDIFASESYRANKLLASDWRLDQVIGSSQDEMIKGPLVHIKLQLDTRPHDGHIDSSINNISDGDRIQDEAFELSVDKLDVLVHELSAARDSLQSLTK